MLREVVDVDFDVHGMLQVVEQNGEYMVIVDGVTRHAPASAEDVMRAMGHYIQSLSYKISKLEQK